MLKHVERNVYFETGRVVILAAISQWVYFGDIIRSAAID